MSDLFEMKSLVCKHGTYDVCEPYPSDSFYVTKIYAGPLHQCWRCGSAVNLFDTYNDPEAGPGSEPRIYYVRCISCGLSGKPEYDPDKAIDNWEPKNEAKEKESKI